MARIEAVLPCHLQLVHSEVRLVSAMDGKLLGLWPFKCIRRYKFVSNLFSIEAGRKAPTGEGIFEFISNECSEIYRVMDTIIRTKAGDTTMRRLASERLQNQVQQEHHPVRKVNSVPVTLKQEVRYEYADPVQTNMSRPPPPSVPLPHTPEMPPTQSEPTYDILSPGMNSAEVDGKVVKQGGTPANNSPYDTLQFANTQPVEDLPPRPSEMAGSPGSYDTLRFTDDTLDRDETSKAKGMGGQYDTLNFGERRDTMNDVQGTKNMFDHNELQHSSGSFYNTLDHSSGSIGSIGSVSSNTYDSLHTTGSRPQSGEMSGTYDTMIKPRPPTTLDLGSNTYDALQHENQKPTGKDSPSTQKKPMTPSQGVVPPKPNKPPPRRRPPSTPKQPETQVRKTPEKPNIPSVPPEAAARKISAGQKPEKPIRAPRKNAPAKEAKDGSRLKAESITDVIQKRLANPQPPVDDGSYASVDHEYTSIDYTKVSRSDSADSSDIYTEPDQDNIRGTPIPKPAQTKSAKPTRNNPKPKKNLFKKAPPKPKAEVEAGNFADELKKKSHLKKTAHKPVPTSQTGQSGIDDDIYDEVDPRGPYYSEPDPYSEPAV